MTKESLHGVSHLRDSVAGVDHAHDGNECTIVMGDLCRPDHFTQRIAITTCPDCFEFLLKGDVIKRSFHDEHVTRVIKPETELALKGIAAQLLVLVANYEFVFEHLQMARCRTNK